MLTQAKIRKLEANGKHTLHRDSPTLYLSVAPGGSKSWIQRITIRGKQRDIGLGGWPLVSAGQARDLAVDNRRMVRSGGDPLAAKRRAVPTFREAAMRTFEVMASGDAPTLRNAKVRKNWMQQLERYAFPALGDTPIDRIERDQIAKLLEPIWSTKRETARKVRQRLRAIFRWAEGHGHIARNPVDDALDGALPAKKRAAANHLRALPYRDVGDALAIVDGSASSLSAKLCLRFIVLTAARSGEALGAAWSEIDMEAREWRIPAERMKAGKEHRVPLSDAAMEVLEQTRPLADESGLVFPSPRGGRVMSNMTLTKVLRTTGLAERATVHGFRSTFRDWAAEKSGASHAVMELSLAHSVGNAVERAYARSDLLDKRRALMARWAEFVTGSTGRKVVPFAS